MKLVEQISAEYHCVDFFGNAWHLIIKGDYQVSYPCSTVLDRNGCDHIYINGSTSTRLDLSINEDGVVDGNDQNGARVNFDRTRWILPDGSVEIIGFIVPN